jgi:hypothetical protein
MVWLNQWSSITIAQSTCLSHQKASIVHYQLYSGMNIDITIPSTSLNLCSGPTSRTKELMQDTALARAGPADIGLIPSNPRLCCINLLFVTVIILQAGPQLHRRAQLP